MFTYSLLRRDFQGFPTKANIMCRRSQRLNVLLVWHGMGWFGTPLMAG